MTRIRSLIANILKIHHWIAILITSNSWTSLDQASDGWRALCVQSSWRPYIFDAQILDMDTGNKSSTCHFQNVRTRVWVRHVTYILKIWLGPSSKHGIYFIQVIFLLGGLPWNHNKKKLKTSFVSYRNLTKGLLWRKRENEIGNPKFRRHFWNNRKDMVDLGKGKCYYEEHFTFPVPILEMILEIG